MRADRETDDNLWCRPPQAHTKIAMRTGASTKKESHLTDQHDIESLKSRFLEGLAPSERDSILRAATPHRFLANSVVINQGSPANRIFLLTMGRVRHFFITEDGHKILLNWLVPGDIFGGYTGLATPASYLLGTETVKDSAVLAWDRVTIRGFAARYPRLLDNGLLIASSYIGWFLAANVALTRHPAQQRFAQVLVSLARGIGEKVPGGIELDVTNEELAHAANVSSFTASRLLSQWERQGAVVKTRGKVLLRSPERLFAPARVRNSGWSVARRNGSKSKSRSATTRE